MSIIYLLLTGVMWGGIGIVMGVSSRRGFKALPFMASSSLISSVAAWIGLVDWPVLTSEPLPRLPPLLLIMCLAGATGIMGMLALQRAMVGGAPAWVIGQSAMIIPFVAGILFFQDSLEITGGLGLATVLLGLLAFAHSQKASPSTQGVKTHSWLVFALMALILLGIQQLLASLPSSWPDWEDRANLRAPLLLLTGAVPLWAFMAWKREWPNRNTWGLATGYAVLVVGGQFFLFRAMDLLRDEARLGLAYPLAMTTCILVVTFWDGVVWHNPTNRFTVMGTGLALSGVILLAV